jgi:hypothetical protein
VPATDVSEAHWMDPAELAAHPLVICGKSRTKRGISRSDIRSDINNMLFF